MGILIASLTMLTSFVSDLAAVALELIYQASTVQDVVQSANHCFNPLPDPLVEIFFREQVNTMISSSDTFKHIFFRSIFKVFTKLPESRVNLILNCSRAHAIT